MQQKVPYKLLSTLRAWSMITMKIVYEIGFEAERKFFQFIFNVVCWVSWKEQNVSVAIWKHFNANSYKIVDLFSGTEKTSLALAVKLKNIICMFQRPWKTFVPLTLLLLMNESKVVILIFKIMLRLQVSSQKRRFFNTHQQ